MVTVSSGAFETSSHYEGSIYPDRIRVEWSSTQNVANNASTINWTVKSAGGSTGYVRAGPIKVVIAGNACVNITGRIDLWANGKTSWSGSFTVNHDSNGTKVLTASAEAALYASAINCTRYGYEVNLPTIPRASSISGGSGTMGAATTISINRASSAFTHTLTYKFGSATGTITTKTTAISVPWTPSKDLAKQVPNATSGTGTITCTTYNGSSAIGTSSINFTLSVPNDIQPTISSFTPSIASTNPAGCGLYVKNNSTVKCSVATAGSYGSTIKKCVISGQNLSYTSTTVATAYSATSTTLTASGDKSYTVTVTDSRGRTATVTKNISIYDYELPTILSAVSFRSNSDGTINGMGTYVTHKISIAFYGLNNKNSINISVWSKKNKEATYGNKVEIQNGVTSTTTYVYTYPTATFAIDTPYDFKIVVSDSVGKSDTEYTNVGTKNIPINITDDDKGVAIGGYAQSTDEGRFDCYFKAHFASAPITGSDIKLKKNVEDIDLDIIDSLRPVKYNLRNGNDSIVHYGLIAQEVEAVLPKDKSVGIVYYKEDKETKEHIDYAIAYEELIPFLIKKCQDLQGEVNDLKNTIKECKQK